MAHADQASLPVLLAGRNRHVRELLARELTREGFSVQESPLKGEDLHRATPGAGLLVLDVELPGPDALKVIREVRRFTPGLPVAVFAHEESDVRDCLAEPDVVFVKKGEDPRRLVETVRVVLSGRGTPRQ